MRFLLLAALAACRSDSEQAGPELVGRFQVDPLVDERPLLRTVSFATDEAAVATWTLSAGDHRVEQSGPEATEHRVSLRGLRPDRVYTSEVRLDGASGSRTLAGPDIASGPLPDTFPNLDVLAWEPEQVEPGFTLLNLTVQPGQSDAITHVALLDPSMEPVWLVSSAATVGYVRWDDGVWGLSGGLGVHWSVDGVIDRRLAPASVPDPLPGLDIPLDVEEALHYDLLPTGRDSFWTILFSSFDVDAYPLGPDAPEVVPNPQTLRDMVFAEVGFDGELLHRWPLSERLDPGRISYSSHDPSKDGLDWAHCNAVNHNPDGGIIVSSRHQDAVVALDEDGDLQWILSNPDGWSEPYASHRLQPVGEVSWPSHQHAPHFTDDGLLVMFDNGNHRTTPYTPQAEEPPLYSRVVGYRIDSDAMTVAEAWSFDETVTGRLYSSAMGDADPQPRTGNVLATYSMVRGEEGIPNEEAGRGRRAVRLVEFSPDTLATVLDLRLSTSFDRSPDGVQAFRADRVPASDVPWLGG